MSEVVFEAEEARRSSLGWVADILGWRLRSVGVAEEATPEPSSMFWVLPGRGRPRILIPSDRRVAPVALRTFNDSMSQLARFRKGAFGTLLRVGLDGLLRLDGVRMDPVHDTDGPSFLEYLENVLGHPVEVGVALGPELRPNMKPVLQVLDPRGRLVGFAKIGWNDLTKRLIDNEAASLRHLAQIRPKTFDVPEVLHLGTWAGRAIVLVSPGPRPLVRRCRRNAPPPPAVEAEVARSRWASDERLAESAYVSTLRERIDGHVEDAARAEAVRAVLGTVLDRWGDASLAFGAWHGDWAPWNMSRSNGRLFVWDWERYGGPVPQGFDHVHLRFQLGYQVAGRSVEEAAGASERSLRGSGLSSLAPLDGLGPVTRLYLIERVLRLEEGRAAGVAVRADLAPAALELLGRSGR